MRKKYMIHPGFVRAKDGDRHYISGLKLMKLYGVQPCECEVEPSLLSDEWKEWRKGREGIEVSPDYIHLKPRHDGDYRIPETNNQRKRG